MSKAAPAETKSAAPAVKQKGDLNQQIWRVEETIAYLSTYVEIFPGDIIMNGTPAGVSAVKAGDRLDGHVDGVGDLVITYAAEGQMRKLA